MTEKRFIFDPSITHFKDTQTDKTYCEYNLDKVVDLLNKLYEKNKQLKKELHKIKVVNEMLSMDFANSEHELWKENEELKLLIKKVLETTPIEHSLAIDLKNSIKELYK